MMPHRRPVLSAMLLITAVACSVLSPLQSPTPEGVIDATPGEQLAATAGAAMIETLAVPPTATPTQLPDVGYPWLIIPIHAIRVMDDDGGRPAAITPEQFGQWVEHANSIFTASGILFTYDPEQDFSTLRSTLLNNVTGNDDPNWIEEITYGDVIAAEHPGRLVVFIRHGPGDVHTGGSFSWYDYNFVAMGRFNSDVCGYQNIGMLAHEIGHYLGLSHTFAGIFGSQQEAEAFFIDHGYNPQAFDGDGLADTPPDPYIDTAAFQCQPVASVSLAGTSFTLPRENIMSYYEVRTGLSQQQIERARWLLALRMLDGMAMPSNRDAPYAREADDLSVYQSVQCSPTQQDMAGFGPQQWHEGDQLFVGANANCLLELALPVEQDGRYALSIYLTRAPDFGQVRVSLDGAPLANMIDTYAPIVVPSGAIPLGEVDLTGGVHILRIEVVGMNAESAGYHFGVDCLSLSPTP